MALVVKKLPASAGDARDVGLIPGSEDPLEEEVATTPVFLPGLSDVCKHVGPLNCELCDADLLFCTGAKKILWGHISVKILTLHITFQNSLNES